MKKIQSKLPKTETSIFSVMSEMALQHNAVNVGQGFPGFEIDMQLASLVESQIRKGKNQYAPMSGVPELRKQIASKISRLYDYNIDPQSDITITAGATQAIFTAVSALIHSGDEVILFGPAYDCYEPAIRLQGGLPIWIELKYPEYNIPWPEVRASITSRTRMIIFNSPHNPTGKMWSADDMKELEALSEENDLLIISDEVYEHITFDGRRHESIFRYPKIAARSIGVFSFGKTFHATGWKVGYAVAGPEIMNEFRKVHQYNVFSVNTPVQYALAEYLMNHEHYQKLHDFYQKLRDNFIEKMNGSDWLFQPAQGAYFQILDYSKISSLSDIDFAKLLVEKHKIATIPVSVFYPRGSNEKLLRICFAKDEETMERATQILLNIASA
jgi:methionine aminotransferase